MSFQKAQLDEAPDSWDAITGLEIKNGAFVYPPECPVPSLETPLDSLLALRAWIDNESA